MHLNLLRFKALQRTRARRNARLLVWISATVVCLRPSPVAQPHLSVISSPDNSIQTDPVACDRKGHCAGWRNADTQRYRLPVRTGPVQRRPCRTDVRPARVIAFVERQVNRRRNLFARRRARLCPASCAKKQCITLRI